MTKDSRSPSMGSKTNDSPLPRRSFSVVAEPANLIPLRFGENVFWATLVSDAHAEPRNSTPPKGKINDRDVLGRLQLGEQVYLLVSQAKESEDQARDCDLIDALSERETQIAVLISRGKATKQIACTLRISEHTVRTYLRRTFFKLQVSNRPAMVAKLMQYIAVESGLAPHSDGGREENTETGFPGS